MRRRAGGPVAIAQLVCEPSDQQAEYPRCALTATFKQAGRRQKGADPQQAVRGGSRTLATPPHGLRGAATPSLPVPPAKGEQAEAAGGEEEPGSGCGTWGTALMYTV